MDRITEHSYLTLNSSGFSRVVYSAWGPENGPPVICIHGLTGNGHDFNWLGPALAQDGYHVISVDMPGRGRSDYLSNADDYCYAQYVQDLCALMAHLGINEPKSVDWIGISMGGLLGIRLAGMPGSPIRRLVLDDIGPSVPQADLDMINGHIMQSYFFDSLKDLERSLRIGRGPSIGPMTDEQWNALAINNARQENGKFTYTYDPRIADVFVKEPIGELDLWPLWDTIDCPVLVLRGENSTLFPQSIADDMKRRGPGSKGKMQLEIIKSCGHVPGLIAEDQIDLVTNWLREIN